MWIPSRVQFVRYVSAPIAHKYGPSGLRIASTSSLGRNESFSTLSDHTTIGVLNGWASSI